MDLTSLNIIRIGTSGTIQKNIPIDSFLLSKKGLDLSGMLNNYNTEDLTILYYVIIQEYSNQFKKLTM